MDRRGQVCQSPSPPWRGHFPEPLWFLSITYQPGQSVAEIKQFLRPDGLWTQQGESSPRSLISLNLKRYINPRKAKITVWMTPVRETDCNINAIFVKSSMFHLRRQEKTWNSSGLFFMLFPVEQVDSSEETESVIGRNNMYSSYWYTVNKYWVFTLNCQNKLVW